MIVLLKRVTVFGNLVNSFTFAFVSSGHARGPRFSLGSRRFVGVYMNLVNQAAHEDGDFFSRHSSNPFDDPSTSAKRLLGLGSSELSDCDSLELEEYGGPILEHALQTGFEGIEPGDETVLDHAMDEEVLDNMDAEYDSGPISDDEYFEEKASIYFRSKDEREEIEEEIDDLLRAVPALKEDYFLVDRLGTGEYFNPRMH